MPPSSRHDSSPNEQSSLLRSSLRRDLESRSLENREVDDREETIAHSIPGKINADPSKQTPSVSAVVALLLIGEWHDALHLDLGPLTQFIITGVFVANAEGSLILASYGRISSDFDDLGHANWLVTSYTLTMSVVQPMVCSSMLHDAELS
jgi:hypothetical protein